MNALRSIAILAGMATLGGCGKPPAPPASLDGKALASAACIRCHTLPKPSHLSPEEWPYLLDWMGNYLGHAPKGEINTNLVSADLLPPQPLVAREEFEAIRAYYIEQSRVDYHAPVVRSNPPVSQLFEQLPLPVTTPLISMVAIDPVGGLILIGSSKPPGLLVSARGRDVMSIPVSSEPVSYERVGEMGGRVALAGHLGTDFRLGSVLEFNLDTGSQRYLVKNHHRIAAHRTADVDGDGRDDLLVCGFGDRQGRVGIWWNEDGMLKEQALINEAGAVWGDIADLDGDSDRDLVIAMGNARPKLIAFVNEGKRRLTPRTLIEREVGWGYNRCLLVDWDGDGDLDLIECAGNNLELRGRPIKAHHGVRILRNDGDWRFTEALFEPFPGAMDVAAGDFNRDGRMDLVATAFYPDWRLPQPTTVLLLVQKADGTVERSSIDDQFWNRWMRVSVGDADGDGDVDVLLGAAEVPMGIPHEAMEHYAQLLQNKPHALLLRNRTIP